jgi:spore coat protein U-like protein
MKRLIFAAVVSAAALVAPAAQAQLASGQFNVVVTLTAGCSVGAIGDVTFTYTSLQPGAATAAGGAFNVRCASSLPYNLSLQAGTAVPAAPGTPTINVTDADLNLDYTLSLSAAGGTGDGTPQAYTVSGTMPGLQAGTCAGGTCNNNSSANRRHTLIVDF